jgi:hypothetical protein
LPQEVPLAKLGLNIKPVEKDPFDYEPPLTAKDGSLPMKRASAEWAGASSLGLLMRIKTKVFVEMSCL